MKSPFCVYVSVRVGGGNLEGRSAEEKEGRKCDSQGGGNREKLKKICNNLMPCAREMGQREGSHYGKGCQVRVSTICWKVVETQFQPTKVVLGAHRVGSQSQCSASH